MEQAGMTTLLRGATPATLPPVQALRASGRRPKTNHTTHLVAVRCAV
jgi:hypothetical protein